MWEKITRPSTMVANNGLNGSRAINSKRKNRSKNMKYVDLCACLLCVCVCAYIWPPLAKIIAHLQAPMNNRQFNGGKLIDKMC